MRLMCSTYSFVKSPPGVFVDFHDPNTVDTPDAGDGTLVSTQVLVVLRGVRRSSTVDFVTVRSIDLLTSFVHVPSSFLSD